MQTEVIDDRVIGPDNLIAKVFRNSNNQTAAKWRTRQVAR